MQQTSDAWDSLPPTTLIEFTREHLLRSMYGPEGAYDPSVIDAAQVAQSSVPLAEVVECVGQWCTDFPEIAAKVDAPVHSGLAEHDGYWPASDDTVAAFASAFTAAPSVTARLFPGCGHNIDHHFAGADFHREQLDFTKALTPAPRESEESGRP